MPISRSITPDYPDLPGGRPQVQVAEAAPAHQVQHEPRGISGQVGPAEGLSDGRAELRQGALGPGQADGPGPGRPSGAAQEALAPLALARRSRRPPALGGRFRLRRDVGAG